jgi:hypothetical protein
MSQSNGDVTTWRVIYRHVAKGWRFRAVVREETELEARALSIGLLARYVADLGADDISNWEYVKTDRWDGSSSLYPPPEPRVEIWKPERLDG